MEQITNTHLAAPSPQAAPDGSASSATPASVEPPPDLGPLLSDCLSETFLEGARKPRHDGWTPERIGGFLRHLAGSATIEAAARSVGLSAASAYAFRNRRQGRAFARMWDAILIHRARVRIAADASARAVNGVVSKRVREGVVVEELHHHDNRLTMAVLTRLDRLAEREAPSDEHLRALAEDLDEFIDCLEGGGDADAFVEARKPPPPPEPPAPPLPVPAEDRDEFDQLARLSGCSAWRHVPPLEIPVADLDYDRISEWTTDQWIRAQRSGFLVWVENVANAPPEPPPIAPTTARYMRASAWARTKRKIAEAGDSALRVDDLHPEGMAGWNGDQWERAELSGLLARLPERAWVPLSGESHGPEPDASWQSSTSSTFPEESGE